MVPVGPSVSLSNMPTVSAAEMQISAGMAVGTLAYMSSEQACGEEVDARTDLFFLGAVLYEMAMGHIAFGGKTPAIFYDAILNRAPTPLARLNPDLPPEPERIVSKALEKDRKLRYQHASHIRADLRRLKRDTDSGKPRRKTPLWLRLYDFLLNAKNTLVKGFTHWLSLPIGSFCLQRGHLLGRP
jgi:serine/threonine protein kinase